MAFSKRIKLAFQLAWIPVLGLGLVVIWRVTSLGEFLQLPHLLSLIRELGHENPWTPVIVSIAIGVGNVLAVPINLLLLAAATAFPGWKGFFCGLAGSILAAWFGAFVGRLIGANRAQMRFGDKLEILSEEIRENGISAVVTLCWVPIAPNLLTNVVAGICRLPYWKLTVGTVIGFLPGLVILTLLGRNMRRFFEDPSAGAALAGIGLVSLLVLATVIGKRFKDRLEQRSRRSLSKSVPRGTARDRDADRGTESVLPQEISPSVGH